jgi:formyl-CoA transferase
VERDHPKIGPHPYDLPPYRFTEYPIEVARSPLLGEHTDFVLSECLGMTAEEIAEARASGAID